MKVNSNNAALRPNSRKQNAFRKLEMIKAERTHQKKLKSAKAEKPKALNIEDKVELELKTKVRDKEKTVVSDVGPNNPNDPAVHEKLRGLLQTGAFNFNPQEREVLGQILSDVPNQDLEKA